MTGERLYKQLTQPQKVPLSYTGKGRNNDYLMQRNLCLFYRYYYYSKLKRIPYVDMISILCNEFWLAERTIITITFENSDKLKSIINEAPTEKTLQQKFNHLNWKI